MSWGRLCALRLQRPARHTSGLAGKVHSGGARSPLPLRGVFVKNCRNGTIPAAHVYNPVHR